MTVDLLRWFQVEATFSSASLNQTRRRNKTIHPTQATSKPNPTISGGRQQEKNEATFNQRSQHFHRAVAAPHHLLSPSFCYWDVCIRVQLYRYEPHVPCHSFVGSSTFQHVCNAAIVFYPAVLNSIINNWDNGGDGQPHLLHTAMISWSNRLHSWMEPIRSHSQAEFWTQDCQAHIYQWSRFQWSKNIRVVVLIPTWKFGSGSQHAYQNTGRTWFAWARRDRCQRSRWWDTNCLLVCVNKRSISA